MFWVGKQHFVSIEDYEDRFSEVNPLDTISPSTKNLLSNLPKDETSKFTLIGKDFYDKEDFDNAIENFSKALQFKNNNCNALYYRAMSYWLNNKYKNAFDDFSSLIEFKPTFIQAYFNRANCCVELRTYHHLKIAISDYTLVINNKYSVGESSFLRGVSYLFLKQEEKSFQDWLVAKEYGFAKMSKENWKKDFLE